MMFFPFIMYTAFIFIKHSYNHIYVTINTFHVKLVPDSGAAPLFSAYETNVLLLNESGIKIIPYLNP